MSRFAKIVLILSAIVILISSYVSWSIIDALRQVTGWNHFYIKWTVFAFVTYPFIYPILNLIGNLFGARKLISAMRQGNKFIDYFFMYPFWLGMVFIIQLSVLFLYLEIIRLLFFSIYKSRIAQWRIAHAWLVIIITLATLVYIIAKIYLHTKTVKTAKVKVRISNLPDNLQGFKIVHITDLHADNRTVEPRIENYMNAANKLEPDIVVFTGDLVTYGTEYIEKGAKMMGKLKTRYGVYACLGDHDYWSNAAWVFQSLKEHGVKVLEDGNIFFNVRSAKIFMTLVTNIYTKRPNRETLKNLANQNTGSSLKIFVTHQPSNHIIEFAAESNYDIFLAGHTHGGQIVFSLFGIKLAPVLFETNYISGQYRFGSMFINVNNGLGLTLAPIRYNAPADITLIKLEKEN